MSFSSSRRVGLRGPTGGPPLLTLYPQGVPIQGGVRRSGGASRGGIRALLGAQAVADQGLQIADQYVLDLPGVRVAFGALVGEDQLQACLVHAEADMRGAGDVG